MCTKEALMSRTIKDVAKLAGVSISTVSRVMNESKPVSPESRKKVLDAIEKLDFKPNELARSLVMKESRIIGVVVKDINISYMAQIIQGIEETGKLYQYDILLSNTYGEKQDDLDAIELFFRKRVDGLIVVSEDIDPEVLAKIKDYRIPYLQIDRYYDPRKIDTVSVEYEKGGYEMTKHLMELGHKKVLYIRSHGTSAVEMMKFSGCKKALGEIDEIPLVLDTEEDSVEEGYKSGETVMDLIEKHDITAIFCCRDALAIGLSNYFYDHKITIGKDISIAGYGSDPMSSIYRPTISTVLEPYYDIGAIAIRKLVKSLKGEESDETLETTYLDLQVKRRESTARI